jgi:gliding motility-associated-like protein
MILRINSKQFIKANKSSNLPSVFRFLNLAFCVAVIFCSTLTVQSAENSDFEPLNSNKTPIPELSKKDRASNINSGDTVVFDYSQAVFVNGNLKLPVSIITDDINVQALDFQFRFNTVDFTYAQVLNTNSLTSILGNFNPTDQILRVFSFDDNILPNNTNLITLSFNTTSTEFCALNPYNILVYLNGDPCSYKVIGCVNDVANAGLDQNICADSTILTANSIIAGTAFWSVVSGSGTFASPNQPATSVSGLSAGANVFRWTFPENANTDTTFDEVTIFRNLPPSIAIAGDNYAACGNSTTLPAEIPTIGTGAWTLLPGSPSGSIQDLTNPNSLFTFSITGDYDLEWRTTSSGGCPESADTIKITKLESANAGADIFVCETQTTLTAIPSPTFTGYWSVVSGTGVFEDSTSATTNVSGLSLGENIFSWTLSIDNCPDDSTDLVSVTVTEITESFAGVDQTICGDTALLEAVNPIVGTGFWTSVNSSVIFADATNYQTTVSNLSFGVDTLVWTITNSICNSVDTVFITSFEQTSIAEAGEDQTVCGNTAQLGAVSPTIGSGTWSSTNPSVIFADATNYLSTASNLSLGVDTLIWTITNGVCTSIDSVIITSIELPEAFAGEDQTVCGDSALLIATNPTIGSGIWSSVNASVIFTDATNYQTAASNLSVGVNTLIWTTTNGLCSAVDTIFITSFELPSIAEAGENQTVCGETAQLGAVIPAIGSGTWTSTNSSLIFADASNYQTTVSNLSLGVDTLIWTITNGICTSVDSVFITSIELPEVFAGVDTVICAFQQPLTIPITITGSTNWIWNPLSGTAQIDNELSLFPSFSNMALDRINSFELLATNGQCSAIDTLNIFVYSNESDYCSTEPIFIPEGFSPNGDGLYDVFAILNLRGLNANVQIYNRWGNLVYSNENYQNDWTGIANQGPVLYGEELPSGTYYYIIQIEGEAQPRKEYLTLWR